MEGNLKQVTCILFSKIKCNYMQILNTIGGQVNAKL